MEEERKTEKRRIIGIGMETEIVKGRKEMRIDVGGKERG